MRRTESPGRVWTLIQCSFVLAPHRLSLLLEVTTTRSPGRRYHWVVLAAVTALQGRTPVTYIHLADVCQRQDPAVGPQNVTNTHYWKTQRQRYLRCLKHSGEGCSAIIILIVYNGCVCSSLFIWTWELKRPCEVFVHRVILIILANVLRMWFCFEDVDMLMVLL